MSFPEGSYYRLKGPDLLMKKCEFKVDPFLFLLVLTI